MMRFDVIMQQLVVVALVAVIVASAKPAEEEKKSRVIKDTLSDEPHYVSDEHNPDYDHEAFLGEDEARTFDQLTPEESKLRLGKIVDRIDQNSDGFVTLEELKGWIDYTQKRYIADDVQRQWNAHNPKNKPELDWEEYRQMVYGFLDNMDPTDLENDEEGMSYKDMLKRDHRRWKIADENEDNMLDIKEFTNFLHPEEAGHMRDIVVLETMEDIDKDKNGKISLDEYIGDMYKGEEGEEEPSWVSSEREQFSQYRDKDSDGFMDTEEVKAWIIPPDYDHSQAEASHLLHESDMNEDQKLSKTEILNKYDLFVGSQATDFGEALVRHDEF